MPTYTFNVLRSGELTIPCSVPWRLEGVGANQLTAELFAGGVLPSGVASFAAGETTKPASFATTTGAQPFNDLTGRLLLHTPVGCKIDPQADSHALLMEGTIELPPDGLYEPIPLADLPPSRRNNVSTLGTRTGTAGMNFVLTSNVSNATLTLGGPGKLDQEIVFRGDTDSSAATGLRTLTNCTIHIVGDFCGLARLVLRNCRVFINNRSCFVTRCEITDFTSAKRSDTPLDVDAQAKSARFSCHKCDFTDRLGPNTGCIIYKTEALELTFAHNLIENHRKGNYADATILIYYGSDPKTTNIKSLLKVYRNLWMDAEVQDLLEIKASDMDWYENTMERCGNAGLRIRHGMRHKIRRNLFIDPAGGALITVRTGPHEISENRSRTASGGPGKGNIVLYAGSLPWEYEKWVKIRDPDDQAPWQCAGNCLVVGNDFPITVGEPSCNKNPACYLYPAENNNLGPTSGPSRNRAVTLDHETGTKRNPVAGYDIDGVLPRATRGAVGLRAP